MTTTYMNMATFTIARDIDLGIELFGVWYRDGPTIYAVTTRGVPAHDRFTDDHTALLFFNLNVERLAVLAAKEEADFQRRALEVEQPE